MGKVSGQNFVIRFLLITLRIGEKFSQMTRTQELQGIGKNETYHENQLVELYKLVYIPFKTERHTWGQWRTQKFFKGWAQLFEGWAHHSKKKFLLRKFFFPVPPSSTFSSQGVGPVPFGPPSAYATGTV